VSEIYVNGGRYEALSSNALYEGEYENILIQEAPHLFPHLHLVRFKTNVTAELVSKQPDFALIDHAYRKWWVIEVELAHHPLEWHVAPQVDVLLHGTYGREHAEYLANEDSQLDVEGLRQMMRGEQPGVVVVVNEYRRDWERVLRALGAAMTVVGVYRSDKAKHVLLMEGYRPEVADDVVSSCRRSDVLPRWLEVDSPAALPIGPDETMTVFVEDRATEWRRVDSEDRTWLAPRGSVALEDTRVRLVRVDDERLEFRPSAPGPSS
jgi:hypothetical protein